MSARRRQSGEQDEQRRCDASDEAAHADHFDTGPDDAGPFVTGEDEKSAELSGGAGSSTMYLARIVLVRLLPGQRLLLAEPCGPDIGFDLLEGRDAAGDHGVHEHQVPAEAGLDRPLPGSRCEPGDGQRKLRPHFLAEKFRRAVAVVLLEHERVGERVRALRVDRLTGELRQRLLCIGSRAGAAPVGREVQVPEAQARRLRELGAVLLEPALELGRRRLARSGHVLGQELHFLRHAALDDLVVLVEAHCKRLAVKNFLLNLVLDEALRAPVASAGGATATGAAA